VKLEFGDSPRISQSALRALHGAGFTRLEQLTKVSELELSKLHGMGPKALAAKNLNFKFE
jgi:hypothetical protein